jgi:hypothetical protein
VKKRINLYRESGKKTSFDKNSLNGTAIIISGVIVAVLLAGVGLRTYVESQKAYLESVRAEKNDIEVQVQTLQARFASQQVNPELTAEQERIRHQIASRRVLLSLLDQIEPAQGLGFSAYMRALSEASLEGSWLTGFSINMAERFLTLKGAALSGPEISLMLEEIGNTRAFSGMSVSGLEVQSAEGNVLFQATAELKVNE